MYAVDDTTTKINLESDEDHMLILTQAELMKFISTPGRETLTPPAEPEMTVVQRLLNLFHR